MDIGTAALLGKFAGGLFLVFVLYAVWEYVLFKRIVDDPVSGKTASVVAAYLTASMLYGLTSANNGSFNPNGFVTYLFGAAVVGFFAIRRGMKLRDDMANSEPIEDTFA